jgi:dihydrofolate reductase
MIPSPPLHAIVAMSENRAIAFEGKLPWHLPLEYRWFKHKTMGGAMIMGRKTFEAIGRALPGRTSLVLSRRGGECPGAKCFPDFESLAVELPTGRPAWVVGGAEIYRQLFPRCTYVYLSRIKRTTPGDVFLSPFEDQFTLNQVIHENDDFRVERWLRNGLPAGEPEAWPFAVG